MAACGHWKTLLPQVANRFLAPLDCWYKSVVTRTMWQQDDNILNLYDLSSMQLLLGFRIETKAFYLAYQHFKNDYIYNYIYINLDQKRTHRIQFSRQDAAPVAGVKGSAAWRLRTGEQIWASARHARHTRHATFWSVAPS
jgi:hypothetical protein